MQRNKPEAGRLRLIAAAFTAFDATGEVALDVIERQAGLLRQQDVDGVFVCGSTGEGPSLTVDERMAIARRWGEVGAGLEVIVQVGHVSLPEARRLATAAAADGADGIAAMAPFYYEPVPLEALIDFCGEVAAGAPELPFLYYHIPALTHVHPPMTAFIEMARRRIPTFAGVKFTSPDLSEMGRAIEAAGDDLAILSGPDDLLLQAITVGARGAVGSTYNLAARHYRAIFDAAQSGDLERASRLQAQARRFIDISHQRGGLGAFKAMSGWLGVDCGPCRLPLRGIDE
ncbi:MAG: dihydrodipicolinate synthase family protein, partial [Candidatus Dormibacteraceae bacterium]